MADTFLQLSATDRRDAPEVASGASERPIHLLEKDVSGAIAPDLVGEGIRLALPERPRDGDIGNV